MVKSFIGENPDFTNEQKEQQLEKFEKALELALEIHSDQNQDQTALMLIIF